MPEIASESWWFTWVLLPLLIFLARIADQTIGTLRLIYLAKGYRLLAPVLGFFEVIIWILAVSQILQHLDNIMCYIAYGGGFAMGNYLGIRLDEKLSIGNVMVRIIPQKDTLNLVQELKARNFGYTSVAAEGSRGKVNVILTMIKRKEIPEVVSLIKEFNPKAFFTIEEVKTIHEGVFRPSRRWSLFEALPFRLRKIK